MISFGQNILVKKYDVWEVPYIENNDDADNIESLVKKLVMSNLGIEYLNEIHLLLQSIKKLDQVINIDNNKLSKNININYEITLYHLQVN